MNGRRLRDHGSSAALRACQEFCGISGRLTNEFAFRPPLQAFFFWLRTADF
jgi:hypothetical protein